MGDSTSNGHLRGLIAAPFTPLQPNGELHLTLIKKLAQALVMQDVTGAFICGTTGEGMSLTTRERMQIAEEWMATAPGTLRVIVHVGHHTLAESRALAAHAEQIGAYGVATLGPTFFPVHTVEQLVAYCAEIAAAAPGLPFYYYHLPALTGVDLPMYDFLRCAGGRIPNLAGIKFTHENLMDYGRCLNFEAGRYDLLFGRDEILLSALALGATGAVGSTYNYMAPIYQQLIRAFAAGDFAVARSRQHRAIEIIALMNERGGLPAGKAMMKMIGLDCGPVRPPLENLTAERFVSFSRELRDLGFPAVADKSATSSAHHAIVEPAGQPG